MVVGRSSRLSGFGLRAGLGQQSGRAAWQRRRRLSRRPGTATRSIGRRKSPAQVPRPLVSPPDRACTGRRARAMARRQPSGRTRWRRTRPRYPPEARKGNHFRPTMPLGKAKQYCVVTRLASGGSSSVLGSVFATKYRESHGLRTAFLRPVSTFLVECRGPASRESVRTPAPDVERSRCRRACTSRLRMGGSRENGHS